MDPFHCVNQGARASAHKDYYEEEGVRQDAKPKEVTGDVPEAEVGDGHEAHAQDQHKDVVNAG